MGRYEFERFNYSSAWRVRDHENGVDYLGSYKTVVAVVALGGEHPSLTLFTASTGYRPTTSKQVTQMLYQWYGINLDSSARRAIEKQSTVNGEYTGEVFTCGDCDVLFSYAMGKHNHATFELFALPGKPYFRDEISGVAVNCDRFYL